MAVSFKRLLEQLPINKVMVFGVFFLCAYSAWACGGVRQSLQWPLPFFASILCIGILSIPGARGHRIRSRIRQDPVFAIGTVFLLLLMSQWINSGYGVEWSVEGVAVMERRPSKWIPWSVTPDAAVQMLNWFFPVWIVLLIIRNILTRFDIKVLLHFLVWNSAALALLGLLQYMPDAEKILGIWDVRYRIFFATFAYPNHAAEWFYLHAALAAGLLHDAIAKGKPPIRIGVWMVCFMLCVVASFLTLSRAGAFVVLGLLSVVLFLFVRRVRHAQLGTKAINAYIVIAIIAGAGLTLYLGAGNGSLAKELGGKALTGEKSVAGDLAIRVQQMPYAWEMIKDYPFFGTGGWGYGQLLKLHLPMEKWETWMAAGKANIHCDPLQFLSEFGVVGMLCIVWVLTVLVRSAVPAGGMSILQRWIMAGLMLVLLHSLIDWPFRCPAILLGWCGLFAALPLLGQKSRTSAWSEP